MDSKYSVIGFTKQFTEEELCWIHNELNGYRWPDLLGEKPEDWDKLPNFRRTELGQKLFKSRSKILRPIMIDIERQIGNTKLLEWHWIHNLKKTKEEYREWLFNEMADRFLGF